MQKQLLYLSLAASFFIGTLNVQAQCLESDNGQYPEAILVPECVGAPESLVTDGYASEYSLIQLSAGVDYIFSSSVLTDYLTISDEAGTAAFAFGVSPVAYTATTSGIFRYYTHTDAACGGEDMVRARRVQCGDVPECLPVTLPYNQGFEAGQTACISYIDVNGASELSGWEINNFFPTDFGDRSMVYSYDGEFPGDDWFFTDGLALNVGTSYNLTFKYRSGLGPDYLENLEVKYGSTATVEGMNMPLLNYAGLTTNFGDAFDTANVNFTPTATGTYYIGFRSYSDADQGYIQLDDIAVDVSLATKTFDNTAIGYYPNPVKDKLHFTNAEDITNVTVYNLLGQQVLSQNTNSNEIDLSQLAPSAYIVKLTSGSAVKSVKIIKQ